MMHVGVPLQMATGDNVVGCWVEVGKVVMVIIMSARKHMEGGGGLGPQTQNRATAAQSWVCHIETQKVIYWLERIGAAFPTLQSSHNFDHKY